MFTPCARAGPLSSPDLHRQIAVCCDKLGQGEPPDAYLMQMGGAFNAFATRFFGRDFPLLYSREPQVRVFTRVASPHGRGVITFSPSLDDNKRIVWKCSAEDVMVQALPADCR